MKYLGTCNKIKRLYYYYLFTNLKSRVDDLIDVASWEWR